MVNNKLFHSWSLVVKHIKSGFIADFLEETFIVCFAIYSCAGMCGVVLIVQCFNL